MAVALYIAPNYVHAWAHSAAAHFQWLLFWAGMLAYWLVWKLVFSARLWGSWLPHLFLRAQPYRCCGFNYCIELVIFTSRIAEEVMFDMLEERGNWLITIAPHVVPTLSLICGCTRCSLMINRCFYLFLELLGFDVVCVWRECHREQTDLQELGSRVFVLDHSFVGSHCAEQCISVVKRRNR